MQLGKSVETHWHVHSNNRSGKKKHLAVYNMHLVQRGKWERWCVLSGEGLVFSDPSGDFVTRSACS